MKRVTALEAKYKQAKLQTQRENALTKYKQVELQTETCRDAGSRPKQAEDQTNMKTHWKQSTNRQNFRMKRVMTLEEKYKQAKLQTLQENTQSTIKQNFSLKSKKTLESNYKRVYAQTTKMQIR